ncbi:MAG: NUDIX hydrolase [Alphaproteobacteria bacterium]
MKTPRQCVGIVCFRGDDVLLIRRGKPPKIGEWSIPGGHIEKGETQAQAALRELLEETGVTASLGDKIAMVPACFGGVNYHLHDYSAQWISGEPAAGDDAAAAEFVTPKRLKILPLWQKTRDIIALARQKRSLIP